MVVTARHVVRTNNELRNPKHWISYSHFRSKKREFARPESKGGNRARTPFRSNPMARQAVRTDIKIRNQQTRILHSPFRLKWPEFVSEYPTAKPELRELESVRVHGPRPVLAMTAHLSSQTKLAPASLSRILEACPPAVIFISQSNRSSRRDIDLSELPSKFDHRSKAVHTTKHNWFAPADEAEVYHGGRRLVPWVPWSEVMMA